MFFLLIIILFVETGGLGFFNPHTTFSVSTGFGKFHFGQILLIITYITFFIKYRHGRIRVNNPIIMMMIVLCLLIIFQIFRGVVERVSPRTILHGLTIIKMIFYFFPMIMFLKNRKDYDKYINILLLFGILSTFVTIYQFFTGVSFNRSIARYFGSGLFRVYHPGSVLIAFCLFITEANLLVKPKIKNYYFNYLLMVFYTIGLLTTFHRSLIGAAVISSVVIIVIDLSSRKSIKDFLKIIKINTLIFSIVIICGYLFIQNSGLGLDLILNRVNKGVEDISGFSGTYKTRYDILEISSEAVKQENFLLGHGLNIEHSNSSPFRMTYDNTYANIFILFGYMGYFTFGLLILSVLTASFKFYRYTKDKSYKAISLAIFAFIILIIITSMFAANFIYSPHLSVVVVSIGLLYLMQYFEYYGIERSET